MVSSDADRRDEEESQDAGANEDEDTGAKIEPIIKLEEVAFTTGEEDEDAILDLKAKLYRFDTDGKQWKERGTGNVKLLKHKQTGKVRLVMRQAMTLKICANHYVFPRINIQEHVGNDKTCVWHAGDFSDGELKKEVFCIRFASVENNKKFMETVESIAELLGKSEETGSKDAASAADLLDKLSVGENKSEGVAPKVAAATPEEEKPKSEETDSKDAASAADLLEKLSIGESKSEGVAPKVAAATPEEGKPKGEETDSKDASSAADLLDKLSIGESKSEGVAPKVAAATPEEEKPKTEAKAEDASSADNA